MKLSFAGGAMEVGGSCIYLRTARWGILMDSGIRQGGQKDPIPDFRMIQEMGGVDAIVISHAHMDHIGTLPMISRAYPSARIYMTPMTLELTRVLLLDSLKIMAMQEEEIPHYAASDVEAMMERIVPVHYQVEMEILTDIRMTFYSAGHIAGAACINLVTPEGTVFYTGDYSAFLQKTIEGIRIPRLRPDLVITECTYGSRLHSNRQVEEQRLIQLTGDAVRQGSKVLIPVFALGRAQEVLLLLKEGMQNGIIPKVPVHVDGMVRDINRVYRNHPTYLRGKLARSILKGMEPFYSDEIRAVLPTDDRRAMLEEKGPAIFVSSSGMLTGGPSVLYAEKIAMMENGLILITGYQDEEAPGRLLLQLMEEKQKAAEKTETEDGEEDKEKQVPTISLGGKVIPVRARVERIGLSAHGDQGEILSLLSMLNPRHVVLVHGDPESISELAPHIAGEHLREIFVPKLGETIEVQYRSVRRQKQQTLPFRMQESGMPDEEGAGRLWKFIRKNYPDRELSAVQIAGIWLGKDVTDDALIRSWQEFLHGSVYFAANSFRLFLFHPLSEEEVEAALKPREWNSQEILSFTEKHFGFLAYKKAGCYMESREMVLTFNFPDAVDPEAFRRAAQAFQEETGWQARMNPGMNHAAADQLLMRLFGDRILRTSWYTTEKYYRLQLAGQEAEDKEKCAQFLKDTGWRLVLGNEEVQTREGETYEPDIHTHAMEQNAAAALIRHEAEQWKDRVSKVSVHTDQTGRYMELSFITPQVGRRYGEELKRLAESTGWRLKVSTTPNQVLVISLAAAACQQQGLLLKKNPSYMPATQTVQVRCSGGDEAAREEAAREILERTGLSCTFV